jgi:hypothetical protein
MAGAIAAEKQCVNEDFFLSGDALHALISEQNPGCAKAVASAADNAAMAYAKCV